MNINNLRFADDIDLVGKDQREVQELTNRLSNTSKKFSMEISREKSKTMVSGSGEDNIRQEIKIDGEKLEQELHVYMSVRTLKIQLSLRIQLSHP